MAYHITLSITAVKAFIVQTSAEYGFNAHLHITHSSSEADCALS